MKFSLEMGLIMLLMWLANALHLNPIFGLAVSFLIGMPAYLLLEKYFPLKNDLFYL